jgi:glycosyltransferase 2 family protein
MNPPNHCHGRTLALFTLKLAGTIGFLWWALSGIEENASLTQNFKTALRSPLWVACGLGMAFLSLLANAVRWQFLLYAQSIRQPFSTILRLTFYGAFFNIASFGSAAGDAVKIFLLMRREPEKKLGVTISVMVDHVIGIVASCIIFLIFTWGFGAVDRAPVPAARTAFVAATWFQVGALVLVLGSILSCAPRMLAIGRRIVPRLINNRWVDSITTALDLHRRRWRFAIYALLASFVLSGSYYLTFHAGLRALGSDVPASSVLAVMPVVDVIAALPISVSGLGVRERAFDYLLNLLTGIETSQAVAASLIGFVFHLFWSLVGGLLMLTARSRKPALP